MAFYVQHHNQVMPHSAFNGLTPDERYFGKTDGVVESFAIGRVAARAERLKTNQAEACPRWPRSPARVERGQSAA